MEIRVPSVGESVVQAMVSKWHKNNGEAVVKDELLCEIETDKITVEVNAETDGILIIKVPEGEIVDIGALIGIIEEGKAESTGNTNAGAKEAATLGLPSVAADTPVLNELPTGGKEKLPQNNDRPVTRKTMPPIRRRIAENLLEACRKTVMLTTFNEADMGRILELRASHKESFQEKYGRPLGLMPFFVKACVESLKEFPQVNAFIDGEDIVYHHYYDIGITIGAEKGLVVPVLCGADRLSFAEIDKTIAAFVEKVKTNRLELSELQGGTFTISNGGVYGSLLSTPILNPPQSGVLGMHAIQERPVARKGEIVIRPMMYLAFTYDHRIIDGREAIGFLRKIKEYLEEPGDLFLKG
jgi:2-oxoglutarate dehydrogenase E2 component (dihydrolipoamide succinyltransferase)